MSIECVIHLISFNVSLVFLHGGRFISSFRISWRNEDLAGTSTDVRLSDSLNMNLDLYFPYLWIYYSLRSLSYHSFPIQALHSELT